MAVKGGFHTVPKKKEKGSRKNRKQDRLEGIGAGPGWSQSPPQLMGLEANSAGYPGNTLRPMLRAISFQTLLAAVE